MDHDHPLRAAGRRPGLRLRLAPDRRGGGDLALATGSCCSWPCLLSWVVFLGFDGDAQHDRDPALDRVRHARDRMGDPARPADGDHADRDHARSRRSCTSTRVGYMAHDDNFHEGESYRPRFFAYLSFFTFAMLALVTADNLLQLFFGWEGVGLASYLLIGFYFRKPSANAAAIKAFVVNRVGDFAFLLGIFALFFLVGLDPARRHLRGDARARRARRSPSPGWSCNAAELVGLPAVLRGDGQVGAAVPAHLAARRDGGPDAGLRADPCGDHGDGGRVPRLPDVAADRVRALRQDASSWSSAPRRRSSRRPWASCRTTSSG